ncbi:hypothetical protein [Parahaliea mediterranea]|uniref:DUF5683 domain-containing protein n=1 Tax=Parahaliea mediterranea TaxID=651086 RepID=A0A939IKS8_9GAMM|nr:hypothetical protein [Parahaliea mediterranea]MBN7795750.1 hypothetical protein [Parahaliea mediterranea]
MDRASKAALLSALVFPGAGQFYLRRYGRGVLLATGAAIALVVVVMRALRVVQTLVERLQGGQLPPDMTSLTLQVMAEMQADGGGMRLASLVLLVLWVAGILDAHRVQGD